jgi:hypothetical protein
MSKTLYARSRNRADINRPAWEVGSSGTSIGGENSINRVKWVRAYSSPQQRFFLSTANVLSGGVGRYGSRMFDSNADGLNIYDVTRGQPLRLARRGLYRW